MVISYTAESLEDIAKRFFDLHAQLTELSKNPKNSVRLAEFQRGEATAYRQVAETLRNTILETDTAFREVKAQRDELLSMLETLAQVPWDSGCFVGFTRDEIELIKHGFDAALNGVHSCVVAAVQRTKGTARAR